MIYFEVLDANFTDKMKEWLKQLNEVLFYEGWGFTIDEKRKEG